VTPRLVLVHGIGPVRATEKVIEAWMTALSTGARRAGHSAAADRLLPSTEVTLAHYANMFESGPSRQRQGAPATDIAEMTGEATELTAELLVEAIDAQLSEALSSDECFILESARAQLAPPGTAQGMGDIPRRLLNAATTLFEAPGLRGAGQWASGRDFLGALAQVGRYLARGEADQSGHTLDRRIRDSILRALDDRPAVVVAHSLGSVVAHEALHEFAAEVPLFLTLGSPLAMRAVVLPRLHPRPPATAPCVRRWLNFWDRDDLVAARPILERDVLPNSRGVRPSSDRIDSDGIWVHPATKYLAHASIAGPVVEQLWSMTEDVAVPPR
jgi:pimeloyl-ACP methyl ester carboxylesterase